MGEETTNNGHALPLRAQCFLDLVAKEAAAATRSANVRAIEGNDAKAAAARDSLNAQRAARDVAKEIGEAPTRTFGDLIEKALVAREYAPRWPDGTLIDQTLGDLNLEVSANLVLGVLSMAGLDPAPVRPGNAQLYAAERKAEAIAKRIADRSGDDPDDAWRIFKSEDELVKLEALSHLVLVLGEAFEQPEHETTVLYIGNRMFEHCHAMRTTLFGDARKLSREGIR